MNFDVSFDPFIHVVQSYLIFYNTTDSHLFCQHIVNRVCQHRSKKNLSALDNISTHLFDAFLEKYTTDQQT